jgi:hypothetical protein
MNFWRFPEELAILENALLVGPGSVNDHLEKLSKWHFGKNFCRSLPSNRYPGLQPIVFVLQTSEPMVETGRVRVHRGNLESAWIEKGKSKVDMCKAGQIEVFGLHALTLASRRPGLVVPDGAFTYTRPTTCRLGHGTTAAIACLATRVAKIASTSTEAGHVSVRRRDQDKEGLPKLRAANIQRTGIRARSTVLSTLCFGIAVGVTASATFEW